MSVILKSIGWGNNVPLRRVDVVAILAALLFIGSIAAPTDARAQSDHKQTSRHYSVTPGQSRVEDGDFAASIEWTDRVYRIRVDQDADPLFVANPWTDGEADDRLAALRQQPFVPLAVLEQKAKVFNEGLYAAVELAAQNGAGDCAGKRALLADWVRYFRENNTPPSQAVCVLFAAGGLGDPHLEIPAAYAECVKKAQRDAAGRDPVGFYAWSTALARIWRQDTVLQTDLEWDQGIGDVVTALRSDARTQANYVRALDLIERLASPWDREPKVLRPYLKTGTKPTGEAGRSMKFVDTGLLLTEQEPRYALFPPPRGHEAFWWDKGQPPDANRMNALIQTIREKPIKLKPGSESGWYDYQSFAWEPLIAPERAVEASRLRIDDSYRLHLEEIFRGSTASDQDTGAKNPDAGMNPGMGEAPGVRWTVAPKLTLEPAPTHCLRQADAYRFVESVLVEAFGKDALAEMRRQTVDGPAGASLANELQELRSLFLGAARAGAGDIGLPIEDLRRAEGLPVGSEADEGFFRKWSSKAFEGSDPDLMRDLRMLVPVFYDEIKGQWAVRAFLGWHIRTMSVSFAENPSIKIVHKPAGDEGNVGFSESRYSVLTPVTQELSVKTVLGRKEFRRLCDEKKTPEAIVAALTGEPEPAEADAEPGAGEPSAEGGDDEVILPKLPEDDPAPPKEEDESARGCCGA